MVLGARRLEAARRLGMTEVPAIVRELDETEAVLVAGVERPAPPPCAGR